MAQVWNFLPRSDSWFLQPGDLQYNAIISIDNILPKAEKHSYSQDYQQDYKDDERY